MLRCGAVTLVLLGLLGSVGPASADPWWGRDKALHLSVSLGLGSSAYGGLWVVGHDRPVTRFALAASLALLPGLAKELYDDGQPGNRFSGKDMMFNAVGALVGAGILFFVDRLVARRRLSRRVSYQKSTGTGWGFPPGRLSRGR